MKKLLAVMLLFIVCLPLISPAQVPEYTVKRTAEKVVIDGILDEADWNAAQSVGDFKFPQKEKFGGTDQTEVKLLWDDTFLYISYKCEDNYIWAEIYDTNATTYMDDCVELFWNPNPEAGDAYNMFEINCIGNLLSVYNDRKRSINERDRRIMVPHIAQTIQGTVNDDTDTDTGWIIEAAIRFSDYPELSKRPAPVPGDMWRIGLNRCGGKTDEQKGQWSPSYSSKSLSFHSPEDFGKITFSDEKVR